MLSVPEETARGKGWFNVYSMGGFVVGVLLTAVVGAAVLSVLGTGSSPEPPVGEVVADDPSELPGGPLTAVPNGRTTYYMFPEGSKRSDLRSGAFTWQGRTVGEVFLTAFDYPLKGQYICDGSSLPAEGVNRFLWVVLSAPDELTLPTYARSDANGVKLTYSIMRDGAYPVFGEGDPAVAVVDGIRHFAVPGLPDERSGECEYMGTIYLISGLPAEGDRGYVPCDGRSLSKSMYEPLFSVIGTRFGGNGTSNFNVPDLSESLPAINGARYYISTQGLYPTRS